MHWKEIEYCYNNLTKLLKDLTFSRERLMGFVCGELAKFPKIKNYDRLMDNKVKPKLNTDIVFTTFLSKRASKVKYVNLMYCKRMLLLTRYWTKWYNVDFEGKITKDVEWFKPMIKRSYWINVRIKAKGYIQVKRLIKHFSYLKTNKALNLEKFNQLMELLEKSFPLNKK